MASHEKIQTPPDVETPITRRKLLRNVSVGILVTAATFGGLYILGEVEGNNLSEINPSLGNNEVVVLNYYPPININDNTALAFGSAAAQDIPSHTKDVSTSPVTIAIPTSPNGYGQDKIDPKGQNIVTVSVNPLYIFLPSEDWKVGSNPPKRKGQEPNPNGAEVVICTLSSDGNSPNDDTLSTILVSVSQQQLDPTRFLKPSEILVKIKNAIIEVNMAGTNLRGDKVPKVLLLVGFMFPGIGKDKITRRYLILTDIVVNPNDPDADSSWLDPINK